MAASSHGGFAAGSFAAPPEGFILPSGFKCSPRLRSKPPATASAVRRSKYTEVCGAPKTSRACVQLAQILDQSSVSKAVRQTPRPRPVDETGSCVWRSAPIFTRALCVPQGKLAKCKRAVGRPLPSGLRCPVFAAGVAAPLQKQTAAPAPPRLFLPQAAARLRSPRWA